MPWVLASYGAGRPPRSRGAHIAWAVVLLIVCLPVAVPSAVAAVRSWHGVLDPARVPSWRAEPTVVDALPATVMALAFGGLAAFLLLTLVRMAVLGWDGPTWRRPSDD